MKNLLHNFQAKNPPLPPPLFATCYAVSDTSAECFVCSNPATIACSCVTMRYCSAACKAAHLELHSGPCARAATARQGLLPAPLRAAELVAINAALGKIHIDPDHFAGRVSILFFQNPHTHIVVLSDVDAPPLLRARGAQVVALGKRFQAAGDAEHAFRLFKIAAGGHDQEATNAEAAYCCANSYIELWGGAPGAGLNLVALSAGCF